VGLGEALGVGELLAVGEGSSEGVAEVVVDQSGEGQPDQREPVGKITPCGSWAAAACSVVPPGWRPAPGATGAAVWARVGRQELESCPVRESAASV
jgi:hypothetical protein